jgi:protein TonB
MSEAVLERFPRHDNVAWLIPLFVVASVGVHAVAYGALARYGKTEQTRVNRPLELVMVDVPKAPPPPPPEEKKPEPKVVKQKPPPIKVASVDKLPPPPRVDEPPPPNDTPPPEPPKPVPLITGISMSSTTTAGSFAAPVGNTLYGKISDKAATPPGEVKPYVAPHYTPIYQVDSEPVVLTEEKIPYPEEARKGGVEGSVLLSITVDDNGTVVAARVLNGPGYGLNEAALKAIRHFKFKPAVKGGQAVSTEMKYTYTFLLD